METSANCDKYAIYEAVVCGVSFLDLPAEERKQSDLVWRLPIRVAETRLLVGVKIAEVGNLAVGRWGESCWDRAVWA